VVCYPARLLGLAERWLAAGTCRRLVCTIKFQGATDHETARRFAAIPGSRLLHLHHNKHELTWMKPG
jgi:23S rRNA (cytidine2498-2'-O)-methyltransferase